MAAVQFCLQKNQQYVKDSTVHCIWLHVYTIYIWFVYMCTACSIGTQGVHFHSVFSSFCRWSTSFILWRIWRWYAPCPTSSTRGPSNSLSLARPPSPGGQKSPWTRPPGVTLHNYAFINDSALCVYCDLEVGTCTSEQCT